MQNISLPPYPLTVPKGQPEDMASVNVLTQIVSPKLKRANLNDQQISSLLEYDLYGRLSTHLDDLVFLLRNRVECQWVETFLQEDDYLEMLEKELSSQVRLLEAFEKNHWREFLEKGQIISQTKAKLIDCTAYSSIKERMVKMGNGTKVLPVEDGVIQLCCDDLKEIFSICMREIMQEGSWARHMPSVSPPGSFMVFRSSSQRFELFFWGGINDADISPYCLGSGASGLVHKIYSLESGITQVMKFPNIYAPEFRVRKSCKNLTHENKILKHIHENNEIEGLVPAPNHLITLYQIPSSDEETNISLKALLSTKFHGDLIHLIFSSNINIERFRKSILGELLKISRALLRLRELKIIHGDVKPENILFRWCGGTVLEFFLADFGQSYTYEELYEDKKIIGYSRGYSTQRDCKLLYHLFSQEDNTNIEQLHEKREVYALGHTLLLICSEEGSETETHTRLSLVEKKYGTEIAELIEEMTLPAPARRPYLVTVVDRLSKVIDAKAAESSDDEELSEKMKALRDYRISSSEEFFGSSIENENSCEQLDANSPIDKKAKRCCAIM